MKGIEEILKDFTPLINSLLIYPIHSSFAKQNNVQLNEYEKEELEQELILTVITSLPLYDVTGVVRIEGYISSRLKWKANNWTRENMLNKQRQLPFNESAYIEEAYIEETSEEEGEYEETVQKWQPKLDKLPPKQREIMELLYLKGLSIGQVAKVMGTDKSNVRRQKKRALDKLKKS